jgi:hypothetical protein
MESVTDSLSEGPPKGVIGADPLIPERMGILGQGRIDRTIKEEEVDPSGHEHYTDAVL